MGSNSKEPAFAKAAAWQAGVCPSATSSGPSGYPRLNQGEAQPRSQTLFGNALVFATSLPRRWLNGMHPPHALRVHSREFVVSLRLRTLSRDAHRHIFDIRQNKLAQLDLDLLDREELEQPRRERICERLDQAI
jgi:hypothetical protein